ncbi:hypothetical protein ABKV19_002782 [Rosa sericea]
MEFYFFQMLLAIIVVIVTWIGCKAIIKWIWTRVKRSFSYMVRRSQDNQVLVNLDTSESLPSSSAPRRSKYDVFLSFRGADTRKGITVDIHDRLKARGIKTFMDDRDLEVGDAISPTLLKAIEESRFAIVVLSRDYASSTWCLEELAKICECMEDQNRILPLFYHVEPSDVRYQKKSFEEAFSKHETSRRHKSEKMKQWRDALNKVASFSGWNTQDYKTERGLVEAIVELLSSKVVPDAIESTGDFEVFEATRLAMDEVMKALKDDEVTAVGVYGMGGVGKTTMVKHVAAQSCKNGTFHHVIMAVVSQNPDFRRVQDALAELLGFKIYENTEIGRAASLRKEIMRREKLLIILDDVWERIELSKIGIPSYKELQKCRSKVLLTTRIWNVCHAMECQRKITLNVLSEVDSWALFVRKARRSFESPTFEGVAKKVAGECRGLPIALITVARALGDKEPVEWERAAQRLRNSQSANPDDDGGASRCIKLSYDYLKVEDYKSYFLLCCLFPEDYDIPIEDLFRYAMGKGLFRVAETLEDARGEADSVAKHLKYSTLLMDGRNNKCVRMHDVVRDTAIQIAQSEHGFLVKPGCGLKDWPSQLPEGCSAISLMRNDIRKLPEKLVCPKLQILLLNYNSSIKEIPDTFFQPPNDLRVLDLTLVRFSKLPNSLRFLTDLRALYLDSCHSVENISMIGSLNKLEIFSMRNSFLKELSTEMRHLTNLRMLDISSMIEGFLETIPPKVISKLHNLEELYLQSGFWEWGSRVERKRWETNAGFDEIASLSKLRVLKVCILDAECIPKDVEFNPNWVEVDICVGFFDKMNATTRYGHNSVCLNLETLSSLPNWFCNAVLNIAERLWWQSNCHRSLSDIFVEYEHGRLHGLKHLTLHGCSYRYKLKNTLTWVPKEPVLENLEELRMYGVDCQELCVGELLPGSLFNLKLLEVHYCVNWGIVLLPSTLLQRLPNLEELNCSYMKGIECVLRYKALLEPKQSRLRKIELSNLDTVRSICDGPAPPAMFQNLQSFSIDQCNLQGSLFTFDIAQCLSQLNYFEVRNCPLLERIVEASNKKIILPKLNVLTLFALPMLSYESATFDIECPSLEHFRVWDCPKFLASSSDFHSRKQVITY